MSRRVEITAPSEWGEYIRDCLHDKERCNLGPDSEKPNMIVELMGRKNTMFMVTVPGTAVSTTLEHLRKSGIGVTIGRVILTSIEFLKPDLSRGLVKIPEDKKPEDVEAADNKVDEPKKKAAPLKGFQHFQKARRTTEELYNDISNGANMNMNTWMNLAGASFMAAGGLATNTSVFIVAAMLVSPIMGPILGMTFGYRIGDWLLFKTGFINEVKMAIGAFGIGLLYGFILGDVGNTYNWPTTAMSPSESQGYNLIISILVSAAAGLVLGVSLTTQAGNALVGTAISAGLLPPIVNAGMMIAYSVAYAPKAKKDVYYEMGNYAILFYASHVITIVIVANTVFWLKDIDPRFREGEDASFDDIPSLVEHKKRLAAKGATNNMANLEKAKAEYFVQNIRDDLEEHMHDAKERFMGGLNFVKGGLDKVSGGLVTKIDKQLGIDTKTGRGRDEALEKKKKWRDTVAKINEEDDDDVEAGALVPPRHHGGGEGEDGAGYSSVGGGHDEPPPVVHYAPFDPEASSGATGTSPHDASEGDYVNVHNPLVPRR